MPLEERLERLESKLDGFRSDVDRDMTIVIQALRTIGKALEVKLELRRLADSLERAK